MGGLDLARVEIPSNGEKNVHALGLSLEGMLVVSRDACGSLHIYCVVHDMPIRVSDFYSSVDISTLYMYTVSLHFALPA